MEKYIEFKDGEPVATPGQPGVVTPDWPVVNTVCTSLIGFPVSLDAFSRLWRLLCYPHYVPTVAILFFGLPLRLLHLIFAWLDLGEIGRTTEGTPFLSSLSNAGCTWFNLEQKHASLREGKSEIKEGGLATGASCNSDLLVQTACCIATSSSRHPVKEQYFPCTEEPSCAWRRPWAQWSSQL